ncbi:YopX family protein, partial [Bacteroides gallinarum]
MKREIKFRAKAINDEFFQGEWVDGYYTKALWSGNLVDIITDGAHEIPIQIETLGQFTGLHDKNKTRIYEGDIVRMSYVAEICTDDDCYEEEGKYVGVATITANKGVCLNP